MKVLVSAASRHGATAEIASAIGETLTEAGLEAALTSTFMVRPSLIARSDRTRRARGSRVHDHVHRAHCCASCTVRCSAPCGVHLRTVGAAIPHGGGPNVPKRAAGRDGRTGIPAGGSATLYADVVAPGAGSGAAAPPPRALRTW